MFFNRVNSTKGFSILELSIVISLLAALVILFNPSKIIKLFNSSTETPSLLQQSRSIFLTLDPLLSSKIIISSATTTQLNFISTENNYALYISENELTNNYSLYLKKDTNAAQLLSKNIAKKTTSNEPEFKFTYKNQSGIEATNKDLIKIIDVELGLELNESLFKTKTSFFIEPDDINIQVK